MNEPILLTETYPRLLQALGALSHIGGLNNRIAAGERVETLAVLRLVLDAAARFIPGASVMILPYDSDRSLFRWESLLRLPEVSSFAPIPAYEEQARRAFQCHCWLPPERDNASKSFCFPLMAGEYPIGAIYLGLPQERGLTRLEELLLENLTNQAAAAIYHAERLPDAQRHLARREEELDHLRRAGLLISSRLRLEETLDAILQMAMEVTNAQYGIFRLTDRTGQYLITRAVAGASLAAPHVEELIIDEHSVMGWAAKHRQTALIHDLQSEPWTEIYYPLDQQVQMRSELAVPLVSASGRLEGVLNLESPEVGAFNEQDRHLIQSLATQAVIAIQEIRLLDALQGVAEILLAQPCAAILDHLANLACDLLNASVSAIWILEEDELVLQAANGEYEHGQRLPVTNSLAGQALLTQSAVTTENVREDERFHRRDLAEVQNWSQALVVPLLSRSETTGETRSIGAFAVYSAGGSQGSFTHSQWDSKVLSVLAYYATLALQNETHQQALRAAQEQRSVAETFAVVGDIAANVLHHLNNKVGTIPVRIQGIQDKCQETLERDPYLAANLREIERSANEAMEAVRDNLSHLRPITLAEMEVAACIAEAITAANLNPGVTVEIDDLDRLPVVQAGQRSLALVFTNLLINAEDAMHDHGTIRICGRVRDEWVEVDVTDSGPGISPEIHDRIFELDFSSRGGGQGNKLGFGLWWVKTLMARLGGSVTVDSDGYSGATFRLRLPVAKTKE